MSRNFMPGQHPFRSEGSRYGQDDHYAYQGAEQRSRPAGADDAKPAGDLAWHDWREMRLRELEDDYRRWRVMAGDDRPFDGQAFEHWRSTQRVDEVHSESALAGPALAEGEKGERGEHR